MRESALPSARPASMPGLRLLYAQLFGIALVVLVADQIVKHAVASQLSDGRHMDVFGGLVRLDFTRNTGAAFGFYAGGSVLLGLVAIAICAGIVLYYRRFAGSPVLVRVALGLILGGAVGNLLDRIRLGYVVDFIDLRWWPVFNLADSAIVVGVALLVLFSFALGNPER